MTQEHSYASLGVAWLINRLGGTNEVAGFFQLTPGAISKWKERGRIPWRYYPYLKTHADRIGVKFSDSLFEPHVEVSDTTDTAG